MPGPTPAWTATALVAVPGEAAAETALPGLWSAPDYAGWHGELASPPGEVETLPVPVARKANDPHVRL